MKKVCRTVLSLTMGVLMCVTIAGCGKDKDKDKDEESVPLEEYIIGMWTASSGKYDLSMEITAGSFRYTVTEPGNGGIYDKGTYSIAKDGAITFTGQSETVLGTAVLRSGKLELTVVNTIMAIMIGADAAKKTVFTKDDSPAAYTVSGSLTYSEAATWTNVSASFDGGTSYAATAAVSNSSFSFTMPDPPASSLKLVSDSYSKTGITVTPKTAKCADALFFARKGTQKAELHHIGLNGTKIASIITYIYVDGDVSVSGTVIYKDGKDVYNLQLKKGWNTIINTWDYTSSQDDLYKTGSVPSSSTWLMESDLPGTKASYTGDKERNVFRNYEL